MLVLTRKIDEGIKIGKDIEVTILSIQDGKVKLGISAPKDVEIYRKEIYLKIAQQNKKALNSNIEYDKLNEIFQKQIIE
ncbi:carbon storage regulator CsrA [Wukongibacter baidiensis]|uniref:carbon storage regulator CsrA n=1 Tax=Wukongibacter baidiensis TaxID=1723361 RepID=UPI003D7FE14D